MSILIKPLNNNSGSKNNNGYPPGDVKILYKGFGNQKVLIKWQDPNDIEFNGISITWSNTLLVRKIGTYPTSPDDGIVVINNTSRDQYKNTAYEDTGLINDTIYYYRFFLLIIQMVHITIAVIWYLVYLLIPIVVYYLIIHGMI